MKKYQTRIAKRRWRTFRLYSYIAIFLIFLISGSLFFFNQYVKSLGPPQLVVSQSSLYYAQDGEVIGVSHSGEQRYWVSLDEVPEHFLDAVVAIEDRNFYSHPGFDFKRIGGAILANMKSGGKQQGASTITQQYARNLFLTMDKTWSRKMKEAFYTIRLESFYSKEQILEGYINTINFGHGSYGVEAASKYYYGKNADELSLAEASMLAGIPKGPSSFSPLNDFDKAKNRQKLILQAMVDEGYITDSEATQAAEEELHFIGERPYSDDQIAPYFLAEVKKELLTTVGLTDEIIALGGLKVYTTLDTKQQTIAEELVQNEMTDNQEMQIGFAAINPANGFVTAMIGGRDFSESSFNRVTQAVRQPGSTVKPFLYYAALEHGFTPATTLKSERTIFQLDEQAEYAPNNYNEVFANREITMSEALAVSDNIYAVKTHLFLGMDQLVSVLQKLGISTKLEEVPSLALGTSGVKVMDLLTAYGVLANGGREIQPVFIQKVVDPFGKVIYENESTENVLLDYNKVFIINQLMTGMFDASLSTFTSVTGSTIAEQLRRDYAGKSGSTDTDYWMVGYTPSLASIVWTGYDQGKTLTTFHEKRYAKEIWAQFMEQAIEGEAEYLHTFQPPVGVEAVPIDPVTGKLATEYCPVVRLTYFEKETAPLDYCDEHHPEPPDEDQ